MTTEARLRQIELKLDRILNILGGQTTTLQNDIETVFATGGIEAVKSFLKNSGGQKSMGSARKKANKQ